MEPHYYLNVVQKLLKNKITIIKTLMNFLGLMFSS